MQKHGLRVIGLALMAALGLMAFTAVSAQAEILELELEHEVWLVGGVIVEKGKPEALTGKQESAEGILKVPAKRFEIKCATGNVNKEKTSIKNSEDNEEAPRKKSLSGLKAEGSGEITFESCSLFLENTITHVYEKSEPCTKAFNEHNNFGKPKVVFTFLFLRHLHVSEVLLSHHWLVVFLSGASPFTELEFGGTCSLPKLTKVTGKVAGELSAYSIASQPDEAKLKANFESETAKGKTLNEIPGAEAKLSYGESPAYVTGKAYAELAGERAGKAWGVM
jgi:hypothetical protein